MEKEVQHGTCPAPARIAIHRRPADDCAVLCDEHLGIGVGVFRLQFVFECQKSSLKVRGPVHAPCQTPKRIPSDNRRESRNFRPIVPFYRFRMCGCRCEIAFRKIGVDRIVHKSGGRKDTLEPEVVVDMIGRAVVSCAEVERAAATSPKVFHLVCHHAFARAFPALLRQGEDVSEDANSFVFYRHDVGNYVSIKFSDVEPRLQRVQRFGDAPFDVPFVVPRLMSKELLDFLGVRHIWRGNHTDFHPFPGF